MIDQVNRLHSSGQGSAAVSTVTGASQVADPTVPLNAAGTKLAFTPNTGSFVVHVTQSNGATTSTLVQVNLKGNASDTTLNSLVASLNGVAGLTASTVDGGKLRVATTATAATVSFSQDTSGTLAALGVNTFFTGTDAADIAVAADLQSNPSLIAAAKNGSPGDNGTAVALGNLGSTAVAALGGDSLADYYQDVVNRVGTAAAAAQTNATATQTVQDTLTAPAAGPVRRQPERGDGQPAPATTGLPGRQPRRQRRRSDDAIAHPNGLTRPINSPGEPPVIRPAARRPEPPSTLRRHGHPSPSKPPASATPSRRAWPPSR